MSRDQKVVTEDTLIEIQTRFVQIFGVAVVGILWFVTVLSGVLDVLTPISPLVPIVTTVVAIMILPALRQNSNLTVVATFILLVCVLGVLFVVPRMAVAVTIYAGVIVVAAFSFQRYSYAVFMGVAAIAYTLIAYNYISSIATNNQHAFITWVIVVIPQIAIGFISRYFSIALQRIADRNRRNIDLLQSTAYVGQVLSKILDTKELFDHAIELIRVRFAYYHVQIFMVDEDRQYANLRASTGPIGQQLLARQHRLAVGSQSVIGRVAQTAEPVIARDTDRDPLHARNELLPNTRAELALPILDGDRIIGALDVQSTRPNAFDPADIQALQILANQLGTAIRNAQLFQAQAASVQENKRLFFESEANLREIQRLNRQLTQRVWDQYMGQRQSFTGMTMQSNAIENRADWSEQMVQAALRRRPVTEESPKELVAVPIVLRGEVIGAIEVETDDQNPDEDMVELVQSVSQRLAISLDNARLFEEAQASTAQEQRINAIVGQFQSAPTVDDLLRITLTELNEALGANAGRIRLGSLQSSDEAAAANNGHRQNGEQA